MRFRWLVGVLVCSLVAVMALPVAAEEDEETDGDGALVAPQEFVHESQVQIRATPVGLSLFSNTGYRFGLFGDAEGALFEDRYFDVGASTAFSPAYAWGGPYLEIEPIAVLNLRVAFMGMGYFGTFGHLYVPGDDPDGEPGMWDDDALDRAWEDDLGAGSTGWKLHVQATPQIMVGRLVATAESSYRRIDMDVDDAYYEPYFDILLEPTEDLLKFRPTLGYLFGEDLEESHFLLGLRWERAMALQADVARDTVGVVFDWGVPSELMEWGSPGVSGFGGVFIDHPTRGTVSPYFGMQASVQF